MKISKLTVHDAYIIDQPLTPTGWYKPSGISITLVEQVTGDQNDTVAFPFTSTVILRSIIMLTLMASYVIEYFITTVVQLVWKLIILTCLLELRMTNISLTP